MSLLSSIADYSTQAVAEYKERANNLWARSIVSNLPKNVQAIFNQVSQDHLVGYFIKESSFYGNAQKSNVAVLKNSNETCIVFYVAGISDRPIEMTDWKWPLTGNQTSLLKIRDVVCRVLIIRKSTDWEIDEKTLKSDFAKCIEIVEGEGALPLERNFANSFALLDEIVKGEHPHFAVVSKKDFDEREYMIARIKIEGFHTEQGNQLAVCGNGIGMDDWKKAVPLHFVPHYPEGWWEGAIRGKQETGEYKLALLKPDGSFKLESGENRKFKDLTNSNSHRLYPQDLEDFGPPS